MDVSFHYTPEELCKKLIAMVPYEAEDSFYEPFKGSGNFFNNFPDGCVKEWSEIDEGRDYMNNNQVYDHIITNPPFRIDGKNAIIGIITKLLNQSSKSVNILMNLKCFNSLTPLRLDGFYKMGWRIKRIHICNIKKWFGRYYYVQFTRNPPSDFISYDTFSY